MTETRTRPRDVPPQAGTDTERPRPRQASQAHQAGRIDVRDFGDEPGLYAGTALFSGGTVVRWSAMAYGRDAGVDQAEIGIEVVGRRRQASPVQRPVEPFPRAVSGEHPTGTVGTVGGRSQADDEDPGVGRPERWDRTTPVFLVGERGPLLTRCLSFPPLDEPRAQPAVDQPVVESHSDSSAPTVTSAVAFHSIQPNPISSATSIWARTRWAG